MAWPALSINVNSLFAKTSSSRGSLGELLYLLVQTLPSSGERIKLDFLIKTLDLLIWRERDYKLCFPIHFEILFDAQKGSAISLRRPTVIKLLIEACHLPAGSLGGVPTRKSASPLVATGIVRILCIGRVAMDNPEYIEALDECCDDPLMVEPLTWDTAFQGWQERASITRDLADRVADGKARQLLLMIADEYERLTRF